MDGGDAGPVQDTRVLGRVLQAGITALEWSGMIIAAATLTVMFLALFVNVVLRYAFGSGIPWAYEIHALLLPWMVAGGIVIAAARGRNIAVNLLPDMLGPRARRFLFIAVNIIVVIIAVSVVWSSQPILKASQFQRLSTLGIKQIWGYSSLIYAFGVMAMIALLQSLQALTGGMADATDPATNSLS
jgi:TRAP-type C4-dicarboxylate transport system permease small subunit